MSELPFDPEEAAGLASLAADDPERVKAFASAQEHPDLRQALEQGERLMRLLGGVTVAPPTAEALNRAAKVVLDQMSSGIGSTARLVRRPKPTGARLLLPASVLSGWGVLVASSVAGAAVTPSRLLSSVALLVLATAAATVLWRLGGLLLAGAAVAGSLVFAAAASTSSGLGPVLVGLHCLLYALAGAALPLGAAVWLARARKIHNRNILTFGAVAAIGALAGMAALHLSCNATEIGHLMVFHAGGVLLAGLIGCAVGALPALRGAP